MGTLTVIDPFVFAITVAKLVQSDCQGPDGVEAHSTVATDPGAKLLQTNTPLPPKDVMTGFCASAEWTPTTKVSVMRRELSLAFICPSSWFNLTVPMFSRENYRTQNAHFSYCGQCLQ